MSTPTAESSHRVRGLRNIDVDGPGQPALVFEHSDRRLRQRGDRVRSDQAVDVHPTADGKSSHQTFANRDPRRSTTAPSHRVPNRAAILRQRPAHQRDQQARSRVAPRSVKATTADGCRAKVRGGAPKRLAFQHAHRVAARPLLGLRRPRPRLSLSTVASNIPSSLIH